MRQISALLLTAVCAGFLLYRLFRFLVRSILKRQTKNHPIQESALLEKRTKYHKIEDREYRIVYIAHKLGPNVPLLMFLHGLGGQLVQFEHQILHFAQRSNILAIDLLGHGKSQHSSRHADYALTRLAADCTQIFLQYRHDVNVIIAHSLGTAITSLIYPKVKNSIHAMVFFGPRFHVDPRMQYMSYVPSLLLDLMRLRDRRGGPYSSSVSRYLHRLANLEIRQKQLAINMQSSTDVLQSILRHVDTFPDRSTWEKIACPLQIIIGEQERVNSAEHSLKLSKLLRNARSPTIIPESGHNCMMEHPGLVNAVIARFLVEDVGIRTLDPAVQLLEMSDPGHKWNMKNYEKWKKTPEISQPIGNTHIYGMKVMREGDDEHSPMELLRRHPEIGVIIDISNGEPPYKTDLVNYRKVPTASKRPPSNQEVQRFIEVVREYWANVPIDERENACIAVHCHYGFNRTGFMVCCYLIEEENFTVPEALNAWAMARPPGIKHAHFKDELYIRYGTTQRTGFQGS